MWPNYALVASNLPPSEFGRHYTVGSSRYYHGQVIFAQIDDNFRNEFFPIDRLLKEVVPNAVGRPKRTKFIATYRVLEHIDLSAFMDLYVTSVAGQVLRLEQKPYERTHKSGFIRTYQEICPFSAIVLSHMAPPEFGHYITDPEQPKAAPKVMFTQIDFTIDDFLAQLESNPFHTSPIPNVHPHKLKEQILEIQGNPNKATKAISLDSVLGRISFLKLRTGFWIASQEGEIFYPIPDHETLKKDHAEFVRSLDG
ncbi:MAG: hypothetical protein VCA35_07690 [Roseibacillus sp.]